MMVGIGHEVMAFFPVIANGLWKLGSHLQSTFTSFGLGAGAFLILSGILFYQLLGRVERHEFLTDPLIVIGVVASFYGIASVCFMVTNHAAWVVLLLGAGLLFIAGAIRREHQKG